jgi:hypothetical protein
LNKNVNDTYTKEDRLKQVDDALSISLLDAGYPSDETMALAALYIEGQIGINDMRELVINKYLNQQSQ